MIIFPTLGYPPGEPVAQEPCKAGSIPANRRGDALERRRNYEPLDVAGVSGWDSKHGSCVRHGFLTIGRPALRLASPSAGTEIMGFFHMFADARMPIWGVSAILADLLLVVLSQSGQRWFYLASLLMLILFVILYQSFVKAN